MNNAAPLSNLTDSTNLDDALNYAASGWPVFPVHSARNGACTCRASCSSSAKHPMVKNGLHQATTDLRQIRRWWSRWPTANIAICTGSKSGLVVLDIDPAHGGIASLSDLVKAKESLPQTLTISTGSDGLHFYFAYDGTDIRNSAGRIGAGLDIRGEGGYVIAPPSNHISGGRYSVVADLPIEPLPSWLADISRVEVRERAPISRPVVQTTDRWASAAFSAELRAIAGAPEGTRNTTLNRAAFNLGQIVAGGSLRELDVTTSLIDAGMNAGLSEHECCATVQSGLRAGVARPRSRSNTTAEVELTR